MSEARLHYAEMMRDILNNSAVLSICKKHAEDKAFFNMLFMTAFRQLTFIKDEVLPQFVKKKIPQKQNILQYILYLGATEILFLNTPNYAVINSYVEAAKNKTDKFGANFVNAILRQVARHKNMLLEQRKSRYFSPTFLKILRQDYTPKQIADMEYFAAIEPALDLSVKQSETFSIPEGTLLPTGSVRLPAKTKVTDIAGYETGTFWVQDAASALAVRCLKNIKGKSVLDLCAAPGGKTAQLLDAGAIVTAVDISESRLNLLKENMARLNFTKNLTTMCVDALSFTPLKKFDVVLIDAPCSSTGTFRRHPEIMHTKTLTDVKQQASLQQKILEKCTSFLENRGILVYATCSLSKLEGEKQINRFLQQHQDFTILPIDISGTENMRTQEGFLRVLPQSLKISAGIDGFFVACLQRKI